MRFGGYELIEKIGVGGMAEVYRARAVSQEGVERTLVIKKILPEYAANQTFIRMLVAEARVSSLLHHANIVQIFELGEIDDQYYIAMEYVDGPDLLAVLTAATRAGLRVPLGLALFVVSEICNGLSYAHQATDTQGRPLNLIHRDISPSNILISNEGAVKLMDFGVASADLSRPGRQRTIDTTGGALKGKLGYMAPEQVSSRPVDHRADLFALGIVLFETLTLKRLFLGKTDGETLANIRNAALEPKLARHPYIPRGVQAILRRALARDPAERYPHAAAFREALLDYLFEQRLRVTNRKLARFLGDLQLREASDRLDTADPTEPAPDEGTPTVGLTPSTSDLQRATFRLRQLDGQPLGAMDFDALLGLIHRRAVARDESIRVDRGPWTTLASAIPVNLLPNLVPDHRSRPTQQGPLNRLTLPTVLYDLIAGGATATLHVSQDARAKTITFLRGAPVAADSTDQEELLGNFMLSRGLLAPDQLAQGIITSAERGLRLGDALIADGAVAPHALLEVLNVQLRARFLELLGWRRGWYAVYEGAPSGDFALEVGDGLELLTQGLRAHLDLATLERVFSDHMDRVIATDDDPSGPDLPLSPVESRLQARLTPGSTVHQAVEGLDDDDRNACLRVLFLQHRVGQLTLDGAA